MPYETSLEEGLVRRALTRDFLSPLSTRFEKSLPSPRKVSCSIELASSAASGRADLCYLISDLRSPPSDLWPL